MGGAIKVLEGNLVNMIAAGEIVERPASVVKELIENSLDAGAESITVEIVKGGRRRIVVVDDGVSMGREDAERSLERHATSKISSREDLESIHTLGFRGEALPSIASVSRFSLFARERDSDQGTEVAVEGGKKKYVRSAGVPPGTRIVVEDLFYSVPARRKFLKTDKTEYYHVLDVVNRSALSRPDVRFSFNSDGREVVNTLPSSLRERVGDILGRKIAERMAEVAYDEGDRGVEGGIGLVGLAGSPDDTRSSQSNIYLYVNDRFVKDRVMISAVIQAYRGLIFKDKHPIVVIFLQLPYSEVDVNVHPAKTQVRFRDSGKIHQIVKVAVRDALIKGGAEMMTGGAVAPDIEKGRQIDSPFRRGFDIEGSGIVRDVGRIYYNEVRASRIEDRMGPTILDSEPFSELKTAPISGELFARWGGMTLLGQVRDTYIVFENEEGLLVIDQHAAHERVVYEWLKAGLKEKNIPMQQLLFPLKIELSTKDYEIVISNIERINELGLEISDFGKGTIVVSSIPSILGEGDIEGMVFEIAKGLKEGGKSAGMVEAVERLLLTMSCHGAIRAGRRLETQEIRALLDAMERTPNSNRCPHGRPSIITIPITELERRFKRLV